MNRRDFLRRTALTVGVAAAACAGRLPFDAAMATEARARNAFEQYRER